MRKLFASSQSLNEMGVKKSVLLKGGGSKLLKGKNGFSILILLLWIGYVPLTGQCTIVVPGDTYQVTIEITPVAIVAPANCTSGYNFNLTYDYDISFTGTNPNLYTLQGDFICNDGTESDEFFFSLPNSGGSGTLTTTTNPTRSQNDCGIATPELLGCNEMNLQIGGRGITYQVINCTELLPIELASFSVFAKNEVVELVWVTLSEQNNDYFTIERSADGVVWETVETLPGAGDSYENLMYQTVDRSPLPGQSYYRLKQTDFDGQFSYSDIKPVSIGAVAAQQMQLFPNPTNGQITMDGVSGGIKSIAIFNALGQRVDTQIPISAQSDTRLLVDMSTLPSGIYTVNADGATSKFFKQ